MVKIAWLPLLLLPLPALGQTDQAPPSAPPAPVSTIPPSRAVLLHHQPTAGAVNERETQQFGAATVQRIHTKEQDEIDEIYADVMRRSNPAGGQVAGVRLAKHAARRGFDLFGRDARSRSEINHDTAIPFRRR